MSDRRPAYSSPFTPAELKSIRGIRPIEEITPEWAWEGSRGKGVRVAIIDSGVESGHPDVGSVQGYVTIQETKDGIVFIEGEHDDSYGHGTACAGIIRKFVPDCDIYSVKVLGAGLFCSGRVFAAGIKWAVENAMHVANMSLGTTKQDFFALLHELADQAYFKNVMLVTAANNMPMPSFPSVYASVISVASHDQEDPFLFYYNPEPPVEFGARGINVRVAWRDGGHMTTTGNSYAAPHMAGLVAKVLGKHPNLTLFQMKVILRALAANVKTAHVD